MSFSSFAISDKNTEREKVVVTTNYDLIECVIHEVDKYGIDANLNHIDVSGVTDFSRVFEYSKFNGDISEWDVSHGETFTEMFSNSEFNGNIMKWDMSSAVYLTGMFRNSKFNNDIGLWNTGNVRIMRSMFEGSEFNKDIHMWDVGNVTDMSYMFSYSKFNQDIECWNPEYCNCEFMFLNNNIPSEHWYNRKSSMYNNEIRRMNQLSWHDGNFNGITIDNLEKLNAGVYSVYLNRDTGKIISNDDGDSSTIRLAKFSVKPDMSETEWRTLYEKIKQMEKKCLQCIYRSTLYGIYPNSFVGSIKPWKTVPNPHAVVGDRCSNLYLIASVNWHAKLAGLPCIRKIGRELVEFKPQSSET